MATGKLGDMIPVFAEPPGPLIAGMSEPEHGPDASPGNHRHRQDCGQTEAEAGPETSQWEEESSPGVRDPPSSLTHTKPCDLLKSPQHAGI